MEYCDDVCMIVFVDSNFLDGHSISRKGLTKLEKNGNLNSTLPVSNFME